MFNDPLLSASEIRNRRIAIIGGVVGGVLFLASVAGIAIYLVMRTRSHGGTDATDSKAPTNPKATPTEPSSPTPATPTSTTPSVPVQPEEPSAQPSEPSTEPSTEPSSDPSTEPSTEPSTPTPATPPSTTPAQLPCNEPLAYKYIGCMKDYGPRVLKRQHSRVNSVKECGEKAKAAGHIYFALQDSKYIDAQCFSGSEFSAEQKDIKMPNNETNPSCFPFKGGKAGASWSNATYEITSCLK